MKKLIIGFSFVLLALALSAHAEILNGFLRADLQRGDSGSEVVLLQKYLVARYFLDMPEDTSYGNFGELTENAVIRYQQSKGLRTDGIVGASTRQIINSDIQNDIIEVPDREEKKTDTSVKQTDNTPATSGILNGRLNSNLYKGITGHYAEVIILQEYLAAKYFYDGVYNGVFDEALQDAARRFQLANRIRPASGAEPTGYVGEVTRRFINNDIIENDIAIPSRITTTETQVTGEVPAAPNVSLDANINPVKKGQSVMITLSSSGAKMCKGAAAGPDFNTSGFVVDLPSETTTYTVTCYATTDTSSPSTTKSVTVTVLPSDNAGQEAVTPTLSVSNGSVLNWTAVTGTIGYRLVEIPDLNTQSDRIYSTVSGTSYSPPQRFGSTRWYSVSADGVHWSNEVKIVWPAVTPQTPSVVLTGPQGSVAKGASVALTWSSIGATNCDLSNIPGGAVGAPVSGTITFVPTQSRSYTVSCFTSGGVQGSSSITISIAESTIPAPVVSLTAAPSSISVGQSSTITLKATGLENSTCAATGFPASDLLTLQKIGTLVVYPTQTTTYTLNCTNSGGSSGTASVTVVVSSPTAAATATLLVNGSASATVTSGSAVSLYWSTTGTVNSCKITGAKLGLITDNIGKSGGATTNPLTQSDTFTLNCNNGATTASVPVTVVPAQTTQTTSSSGNSVNMKANGNDGPITITAGTNVVLTWTTSGSPQFCMISSANTGLITDNIGASGGITVYGVTRGDTYTISCDNGATIDKVQVITGTVSGIIRSSIANSLSAIWALFGGGR